MTFCRLFDKRKREQNEYIRKSSQCFGFLSSHKIVKRSKIKKVN